jgi:hypothetical protein
MRFGDRRGLVIDAVQPRSKSAVTSNASPNPPTSAAMIRGYFRNLPPNLRRRSPTVCRYSIAPKMIETMPREIRNSPTLRGSLNQSLSLGAEELVDGEAEANHG